MALYDCFTFFNEFELLELRLKLLNPIVDYFVIVEANKTQRGVKKKFNFEERKNEFSVYAEKIIYIKVMDLPEYTGEMDWAIENFQRNCITRGLKNCKPNDLVIVSDLDEIPNPDLLKALCEDDTKLCRSVSKMHRAIKGLKLKNTQLDKNSGELYLGLFDIYADCYLKRVSVRKFLEKMPIVCQQDLFYYYMNAKSYDKWYGSVISLYKNMNTPQKLRDLRRKLPALKNGGWHFSYLGGIKRIMAKINATVEGEPNLASQEYTEEYVKNCIRERSLIYTFKAKGKVNEFEFITLKSLKIDCIDDFIEKYPYLYWQE